MESEIQKRIAKDGIIISRIPGWAKDLFIVRAKEEFCSDYGMCLSAMIKECGEYNQLKQMFFENDLNVQLVLGSPSGETEEKEEEGKVLKFGNGKIINLKGVKNE